jgi:N6-L-threonylcarbamoyladenine synthase
MILLAIETSCDETSVALLKRARGKQVKFEVLSHTILSQIDIHKQYGGVFPALAKREHARTLTQLIAEALLEADLLIERTHDAPLSLNQRKKLDILLTHEEEMKRALFVLFEGIQKPKIDAIAVTAGPGLEPALWVGVNAATALGYIWNLPVYPVNHMEGHIIASLLNHTREVSQKKSSEVYELPAIEYPALALLISGGHTELVRITKERGYHIIGDTRDDAVGECFDKSARLLGLPYPGGPEISRLATIARSEGIPLPPELKLPRPMLHSPDLDFSFSGLKTAVLTRVEKQGEQTETFKKIMALEIENAITDVLIAKVKKAGYEIGAKSIVVGGGVSANTHIRDQLKELAKEQHLTLYIPDKLLSTDNSLMIGATGLLHIAHNIAPKVKLRAWGSWKLDQKFTL